MKHSLLEVKEVKKQFESILAVDDCSLIVKKQYMNQEP